MGTVHTANLFMGVIKETMHHISDLRPNQFPISDIRHCFSTLLLASYSLFLQDDYSSVYHINQIIT